MIFYCWCVRYGQSSIGTIPKFLFPLSENLLSAKPEQIFTAPKTVRQTSAGRRSKPQLWFKVVLFLFARNRKPAVAHLLHADAAPQIEAAGNRKCVLTFVGPACEAVLHTAKDHEGNRKKTTTWLYVQHIIVEWLTEGSPKLSEGLKLPRRWARYLYGGKTAARGTPTLFK